MSRLIIDAHVHAQRFTPGHLSRGEAFTYEGLEDAIMSQMPFDNSRMLLADMDRLGIDMSAILAAFTMRNDMILEQIKRHPDRFIGFCCFVETSRDEWVNDVKFDPERAAREVDFWLSNGFTGVGELSAMLPAKDLDLSIDENLRLIWPIMDVCQQHKAPILFHTGCIAYRSNCRLRAVDPILVDDIALKYPDIPIVIGHAGVQTGWYKNMPENAAMVAARHPNVYLELSQCQQEQIERLVHDPNIGPDKLIYGSDWGTSISYQYYGKDKTYASTPPNHPPHNLPLHMDWNLRQVRAIEMPEDERAKILGLNMARICGVDTKAVLAAKEARYGEQIAWSQVETAWDGK